MRVSSRAFDFGFSKDTIDTFKHWTRDSILGDIVRVVTSGGGSWGNPAERDPLAVLQDVKDGFVSVHRACEDYGVVIAPDTWKIDWRQTQARRAALPSSPPLFDRGEFYEQMERVRKGA